jgi:hypothetical protein
MNEITAGDAAENAPLWRRSSYCANGACVEIDVRPGPNVRIRDGKLGDDSRIIPVSRPAFRALIDALKRGELGPPA